MSSSESSNKSSKKSVIIVALAILSPFIYPAFLRLLIKINIFHSLDEYNMFKDAFSNKYTLISVLIMLLIFFSIFIEKFPKVKEFLMSFGFKFKVGDKEIFVEPRDYKKSSKELFENTLNISSDELNETKFIIKNNIKNNMNNINRKDDEIKELENLIMNIKFFSAYNNTNYVTKELLLYLEKEKDMPKQDFEKKLKEYYNKKIKNVWGKKKENCIRKNIEEKIFNYIYLEILEISEDDKKIILTNIGSEFVKKYLMKEVS